MLIDQCAFKFPGYQPIYTFSPTASSQNTWVRSPMEEPLSAAELGCEVHETFTMVCCHTFSDARGVSSQLGDNTAEINSKLLRGPVSLWSLSWDKIVPGILCGSPWSGPKDFGWLLRWPRDTGSLQRAYGQYVSLSSRFFDRGVREKLSLFADDFTLLIIVRSFILLLTGSDLHF